MKKFRLLHIVPLFLFLLFAGCSTMASGSSDFTDPPAIPTPTPVFEEFATNLFLEEISSDTISLHYSLARPENYGISDYPITLGSVSDLVSFDESIVTIYEQILDYEGAELSKEEQRTYDTLRHHLEVMLLQNFSPYLSELLGPTTGYQAQLPILLAEFRFDTKEDVERYLNLMPCILEYFQEIAAFEKEKSAAGYFMNDTTAKEIIAQCEEFTKNPDTNFLITTFANRLEELPLTTSEKTEYVLANQSALYAYVFPAYELLAETLTECLGTGKNNYGLCYFEDGAAFYELLLRSNTGSDRSIKEIKSMLSAAIDSGCNTMALALAKDPALYDNAMKPDFPETEPDRIISYLEEVCATDFPQVDCEGYAIKYIPASLQDFVSPAMYLIPPMDRFTAGVIYINPAPRYASATLFPTIAHEGYPGHLYQTVATLSSDIHPLRYLLAGTGYEEGWATYVETYCYKYAGFSEALTSFLQADQMATLCLYALSDIYIHYDGYTPEQLSGFLTSYGFPETSAKLIYDTLLAEPGAYLPYALGGLEFFELSTMAKDLWGTSYSDYRFHEFLLEAGPQPFSLLQAELRATIGK